MRGNKTVLVDLARIRSHVAIFIDGLIQTLDMIDADSEDLEECDLEDTDIDDDDIYEPSLGATEYPDQRRSWRRSNIHTPDLERDPTCCEFCP